MIAVVQRVSEASVTINNEIVGKISKGLLVLWGIAQDDTEEDIQWLSQKLLQLRIFGDSEGKMNLSILDIKGDILLISQFTLLANTKKGNRPSFIEAAKPELAIPLYEKSIQVIEQFLNKPIEKGVFGADMKVSLVNDGPVTIILNSKDRK
jgi:D-aminoacyl-tRNA deacylase